jgi:gluconate 2-dehydrogenase gamma chain
MLNKLSRRSLLGATFLATLPPEALQGFQDALHDHAHTAADPGDRKLQYLDAASAGELERLASQIIPADESGPGAKEAGVIYFIDRALATFDSSKRALYRDGLAASRGKSAAEIEHTAFFEALRQHVVIGFLASPVWGGNRDKSGWKLIGFDDAGSFQPPFGFYDMPEHRG